MDDPEELRQTLAYKINQGNCVLVLGSGASMESSQGQEVPLHSELAKQLAAGLSRDERRDLNAKDLRHVSQVLLNKTHSSTGLQNRVVAFYQQFAGKTTDFHRKLATLPFKLCITTTPDDFLFNAFKEAGKNPNRDFYHFNTGRLVNLPDPTVQCPLVYHLYGHTSDPQSLVITENDLIDFLTNVVRKAPPLHEKITGTLSRPKSSALFMDLGFKSWYLRVLLKSLGLDSDRKELSVAVESSPEFFSQGKEHQTMVYFSAPKTMAFPQESLDEFVTKLQAAYSQIPNNQAPVAEPPLGSPMAFISYASEDQAFAQQLESKLRNAGVAIWRDEQNLRVGDNWRLQLEHVIWKVVNYVVAVQTPSMLERPGVFLDEINQALDRQRLEQKRAGDDLRKFVIPVRAGVAGDLPALAHLHALSVATDDGIQALSRAILEDWNAHPREKRVERGVGASDQERLAW